MLRARDFTTSLLLATAWFEVAELGAVKPMQMVAQCIGNRVRLGWGDWQKMLSPPTLAVYSALAPEVRAQRLAAFRLPEANDPRFLALLPLMEQVYDNSGERLAGEATLWADLRSISNPWFEAQVLRGRDYQRMAQSGTLVLWG